VALKVRGDPFGLAINQSNPEQSPRGLRLFN
jgi:hypothetical protein